MIRKFLNRPFIFMTALVALVTFSASGCDRYGDCQGALLSPNTPAEPFQGFRCETGPGGHPGQWYGPLGNAYAFSWTCGRGVSSPVFGYVNWDHPPDYEPSGEVCATRYPTS